MIGRPNWRCNARRKPTMSGPRMLWARIWKNRPSRCRSGLRVIAAMVESRSCRSHACWIGVWPRGAQVRRQTGCSMKPLSSKKTMTALRRAPFFYPRPLLAAPTRDLGLVSLARQLLRLLATPAQLPQQSPHVRGVIGHPEVFLNHQCDPRARPEIRGKAGLTRATQKNLDQLAPLVVVQPWLGARMRLGLQSAATLAPQGLLPLIHRRT